MDYYGLTDTATGDLKSIGTAAMFADGNIANVPAGMTRVDFGATKPDLAAQRWNSTTRQFEARPAPITFDRADELRQRVQDAFQANTEFMSVYNTLTTARKNTLRTSMDTVLTAQFRQLLGGRRWRGENEPMDDL